MTKSDKTRLKNELKFKEKLANLKEGTFTLIGEYVNVRTKTTFKHNTCGHTWEVAPVILLNSTGLNGCPKCQYSNRKGNLKRGSTESLIDYMKTVHNTFYEAVPETVYVNSTTKLAIKHVPCGTIFDVTPTSLKINNSCPVCSKGRRNSQMRSHKEFCEAVSLAHDKAFTVLDSKQYCGANEKVVAKHEVCGTIWEVRANHLLRLGCCPKCKSSKGELLVESILKTNKISFTRQKRFADCKNFKELPFDFYIEHKDKRVAIEYDGEQHFKALDHFGGVAKFEKTKVNDEIKNQYCLLNNIQLVRVDYTMSKQVVEEKVLAPFNLNLYDVE